MSLPVTPPDIVPIAIAWALAQSENVLVSGLPLNESGIEIARRVGVNAPERVRIQWVTRLPVPNDPAFQPLLDGTGLAEMDGLTLGYAIFLVRERTNLKLLAHELRHVHQYEQLGGVHGFMPVYLEQVAQFGYESAPLEEDARAHESVSTS